MSFYDLRPPLKLQIGLLQQYEKIVFAEFMRFNNNQYLLLCNQQGIVQIYNAKNMLLQKIIKIIKPKQNSLPFQYIINIRIKNNLWWIECRTNIYIAFFKVLNIFDYNLATDQTIICHPLVNYLHSQDKRSDIQCCLSSLLNRKVNIQQKQDNFELAILGINKLRIIYLLLRIDRDKKVFVAIHHQIQLSHSLSMIISNFWKGYAVCNSTVSKENPIQLKKIKLYQISESQIRKFDVLHNKKYLTVCNLKQINWNTFVLICSDSYQNKNELHMILFNHQKGCRTNYLIFNGFLPLDSWIQYESKISIDIACLNEVNETFLLRINPTEVEENHCIYHLSNQQILYSDSILLLTRKQKGGMLCLLVRKKINKKMIYYKILQELQINNHSLLQATVQMFDENSIRLI